MNAITAVSKCLLLVAKGADLINDVDRMWESQEFHCLQKASLATRTTLFFLSVAEIAFGLTNQGSSEASRFTKNIEVLTKLIDTPIQALEAFDEMNRDNTGIIGKIRIFEKKILGSFIGLARTSIEADLQQQQYYLSLSPDEQAKLQFPIYKYDSDSEGYEVVGYRPFNLQDCQNSVVDLEKCIPVFSSLETAAHLNIGAKILGISAQAFNMLTHRMAARGARGVPRVALPVPAVPAYPAVIPVVAVPAAANQDDVQEICELTRLNFIPVELEEDDLFKQFICAITHRPIRHIVSDPTTNNTTYYERSAILTWLNGRHTSPMTRQTLLANQLTPCAAIQMQINQRLNLYSQRLKAEIEKIAHTPVNQVNVNAAIAESKN